MINNEKMAGKELNIAIVCDPITDCTAGSFVSTLRFAGLLRQRGHKIIFIAAKSPKNQETNYYQDIKVYRFFSILLPKTENQFYLSFPVIRKVKKILQDEKIDILHVVIPTPSAVASIKAAKDLGVKIIAHSHTQPENIFLHFPKSRIISGINKIFYKYIIWVYNHADAIIYPTQFAKNFFVKLNNYKKTAIISNGVDLAKFKKVDTGYFFKKFNLSKDKKNILYVGRLHPEKSVDTLIKAMPSIMRQQPDAHLFIVGFGHLGESLKKLAIDLGVYEHITFFGKVSDDDLISAYSASDVFVLPSLAELEGMVVLEAMACGKPIVVADSPQSASPFFVDGNGLLFKSEDHEDLSEKLLLILGDRGMLKEMGEISLQKSRQYDINKSISDLENLYYHTLSIND